MEENYFEEDYFVVHMETVNKALKENLDTGMLFFLLNGMVSDRVYHRKVNEIEVRLEAGEIVIKSYRELSETLYRIHQGRSYSKPRYVYLLLKRLERKGYLTIKSFEGYKLIYLNCFDGLIVN